MGTAGDDGSQTHRAFRKQKAGKKVIKAKANDGKHRHNAKAFTFTGGYVSRARRIQRSAAVFQKRGKRYLVTKTPDINPPPMNIVVHGPKGCGKTTLIRSLTKYYTKENLKKVEGPITVVAGKNRRLTFLECPSDNVGAMIDLAKVGDFIILMVNSTVGLENDTFEMINTLQQHGFPRVYLMLTHLDVAAKQRVKVKQKAIKNRFWKETHPGNKVYAMGGMEWRTLTYRKLDVMRLAKKLQGTSRQPLSFRDQHSYVVPLHFKDVTDDEEIEKNIEVNRTIELYGYTQGARLRPGSIAHIPGAGDFTLDEVDIEQDPCPLPEKQGSKTDGARSLRRINDTDRLIFAPYSAKGAVQFEKGAMFIKVPKNRLLFTEEKDIIRGTNELLDPELLQSELPESIKQVRDLHNVNASALSAIRDEPISFLPDMDAISDEESTDQNNENTLKIQKDSESHDKSSSSSVDESSEEEEEDDDHELLATLGKDSHMIDFTYEQVPSSDWLLSKVINCGSKTSIAKKFENTTIKPTSLAAALMVWSSPIARESLKSQRFITGGWKDVDTTDMNSINSGAKDLHTQAEEELKAAQEEKKKSLAEFDELGADVGMTGAPLGSYVKIKVKNIPFKWVVHRATNLKNPIIIGQLLPGETKMGQIQCTIKMHRWNDRQLKSSDPMLISIGWRRFQSNPTYCIEDRNKVRVRYLKYTPLKTHCLATFAGPAVAPNSGIVFIKNFTNRLKYFRISATGVVTACASYFEILKKIKLMGTPAVGPDSKPRVFANSAFIQGMFTSALEANKFKGCKIQTVSGIRGRIKTSEKDSGIVRCSFEGNILRGGCDTKVFLKSWVNFDIKSYYNPQLDVPSWNRMKSIAELRHKFEKEYEDVSNREFSARQTRYELEKKGVRLTRKQKENLPFDMVLEGNIIQDRTNEEKDPDVLLSTKEIYSKEEIEREELRRKLQFIRDDRVQKADKKREDKKKRAAAFAAIEASKAPPSKRRMTEKYLTPKSSKR